VWPAAVKSRAAISRSSISAFTNSRICASDS